MRSILIAFAFPISLLLSAQAPQAFDFQGVARDLSGNVLSVQAITVRVSIRAGAPQGTIAYQESHAVTTGTFGLFSLQVGAGTPVQGNFAGIGWGTQAHFLQVEMDAAGGTTYQDMGTTQLLSVPYALHAATVDCFTVSLLGDTLRQGNDCHVIIPGISVANGGCLDLDADGVYDRPGCGAVDCDDLRADTYPGALELCGDGRDNDCDGLVDNNSDVLSHLTWYLDADGDGYGTDGSTVLACSAPVGYVLQGGDCDDTQSTLFPGHGCSDFCTVTEISWVDQNQALFDSLTFDAFVSCFGSSDLAACMAGQISSSGLAPVGALCLTCVVDRFDCITQNCLVECLNSNGSQCDACMLTAGCGAAYMQCMGLIDSDGDGWSAGSDCNDADASLFPLASEVCNGIDDDCDGLVDELDPGLVADFVYYRDQDSDGWGINRM